MANIYKYEELNKAKGQHIKYSNSYEVKFWIKENELWKQKVEEYYASNRESHKLVVDKWKEYYKWREVKFVSVRYQ